MDQRDAMPMTLAGSASYYLHQAEGLQNSPNMTPLSNPALHYQSNAVPTLPLDTSSTMSAHGVNVGPTAEPVRRKRGRPRKYGHDGSVSLALSSSMSNPASIMRPAQKWRGRPKQQLSSLGGSVYSGAGTMTPHIINVAAGEDIKRKVLSLLQGHRVIVILSGIGSISAANIKISSSNGSVTYEGHFDMVNLSGSYINDVSSPAHGPTGGINVTFAGADGRLIGGPIEGVLIAASPVQVIVGILMHSTSKTKNKGLEDPGYGDHSTVGTSANIQPSQNFSEMSGWPSSR